jgi:hypothetical protein
MNNKNVKFVVFVPTSHADEIRTVLGEAGAGKIGNYDFCTFSTKGIGRFHGNENSNPAIGKSCQYESVEEERIETVVPYDILESVIEKVKKVYTGTNNLDSKMTPTSGKIRETERVKNEETIYIKRESNRCS